MGDSQRLILTQPGPGAIQGHELCRKFSRKFPGIFSRSLFSLSSKSQEPQRFPARKYQRLHHRPHHRVLE